MSKYKRFFVTGIDTEIGKTVVSAMLTEALQADYWKPIQSGDLHQSDTMKVQQLVQNTKSIFHPEAYRFTTPASPHYSAALENITIDLNTINLPSCNNTLIIEGAGGLMVPLNNTDLMIDLIAQLEDVGVILVSKNYLGSINHTLLSIEALQRRNIPIIGLVFNGTPTPATESIIELRSQLPVLARIPLETAINPQIVAKYAPIFQKSLLPFQ